MKNLKFSPEYNLLNTTGITTKKVSDKEVQENKEYVKSLRTPLKDLVFAYIVDTSETDTRAQRDEQRSRIAFLEKVYLPIIDMMEKHPSMVRNGLSQRAFDISAWVRALTDAKGEVCTTILHRLSQYASDNDLEYIAEQCIDWERDIICDQNYYKHGSVTNELSEFEFAYNYYKNEILTENIEDIDMDRVRNFALLDSMGDAIILGRRKAYEENRQAEENRRLLSEKFLNQIEVHEIEFRNPQLYQQVESRKNKLIRM